MTINLNIDLDFDELDIDYRIHDLGVGGSHPHGGEEDMGHDVEIRSVHWGRKDIVDYLGEKELEKIREYLLEREG